MSKRKDGQARAKYTLEFKLKALRLVIGSQTVPVTDKVLGVPVQTLGNWVRLSEKRQLERTGDKPVSVEQMEPTHRTKYKAIPVEKKPVRYEVTALLIIIKPVAVQPHKVVMPARFQTLTPTLRSAAAATSTQPTK